MSMQMEYYSAIKKEETIKTLQQGESQNNDMNERSLIFPKKSTYCMISFI